MSYLLIFAGGGLGAVLRFLSSQFVNSFFKTQFAFGTIFVNGVGALLIGFLAGFLGLSDANVKWKLFVITGFLGGYTTFSAYSLETVRYFLDGNLKYAFYSVLLNNVLCLLLAAVGIFLFSKISAD